MGFPIVAAGLVMGPRGIGTIGAMLLVGRLIGRVILATTMTRMRLPDDMPRCRACGGKAGSRPEWPAFTKDAPVLLSLSDRPAGAEAWVCGGA